MSPEAIPRDTCVIVGQFTVDLTTRQVFLWSEPIDLQWRQFEALRLLVEANGEPVEWPDSDRPAARLLAGSTATGAGIH